MRQPSITTSEDESNMESLDQPTDFSDLPIQVNWNTELPANISVPPVNMHSLVLDFSAVSFLDISALRGLKMVKMAYYEILFISLGLVSEIKMVRNSSHCTVVFLIDAKRVYTNRGGRLHSFMRW